MALYIDSAFLNDIMHVTQTVPLAGITTNPSILLAARERGKMKVPMHYSKLYCVVFDSINWANPHIK